MPLNAKQWLTICNEVANDLEKLVDLLDSMLKEGRDLINNGFNDIYIGFVHVAKRNMNSAKEQLNKVLQEKDYSNILFNLCSIQTTHRYFKEEDLSWSKLWDDAKLFKSIMKKINILMGHEEVGFKENEFSKEIIGNI